MRCGNRLIDVGCGRSRSIADNVVGIGWIADFGVLIAGGGHPFTADKVFVFFHIVLV
jgi:hypothetical protein